MSWYENKHALVTGGGSGIGAAVAKVLKDKGARVTIAGRNADRLEAAASDMGVAWQQMDVTDRAQVRGVFDSLSETTGPVEILVNNAGAAWGAPFDEFPEEGWDKVMDINLKSVFFLTQQLAPLLRAAAGDTAARRELVELHGPVVWGICRRLCAEPEDAYQEIWEKVLRALPRFDPGGRASLRTWIATIAHRHLVDRHRRRTVRGQVVPLREIPPLTPDLDERLAERQRVARLEAALQRLPEAQRRVVVMHHLHGVSIEEIATPRRSRSS